MVNNRPKITVLMTIYNGEKTLRRAIESILSQTFRDFEFLIIDDCSTDKTVDIIKSYSDGRIRLHLNDVNIGQTRSLNVGLKLSRSEYIARMDADDYSMRERLEIQYGFIKKNPEYSVVGTDCLVVDASNNKMSISRGCVTQEDIILKMLYGSPINHVSALMNLESVNKVGGYRPESMIAADFDLWSRLVKSGYKLTTIPDVLTAYTFSSNSYSYRSSSVKNKEVVDIVYDNIRSFSNCIASRGDVELIMRMFLGEIDGMTDENVLRSQALFEMIVEGIKPDLCQRIKPSRIKNILSNNYHVAAYRLILGGRLERARNVILRCMSNNNVGLRSLIIYLLTYLRLECIRKINYYRSKYI